MTINPWCVAVGSTEYEGDYDVHYSNVVLETALEIAENLRNAGKEAWALPDFGTRELQEASLNEATRGLEHDWSAKADDCPHCRAAVKFWTGLET